MKTKVFFYFALLLLTVLVSCKKDPGIESIIPAPVVPVAKELVTEYWPLKVGSYWVYHTYKIDTNSIEYYFGIDSIKITKDSVINGRRFYLQKGTFFGSSFSQFLADSADYIIHDDGHRLFSHTNFTDTLLTETYSNFDTTYYKMVNRGSTIQVPAGTYQTIDRHKITYSTSPNPFENPRTAIRYYAKGIGFVKEREFYINNPEWLERRLVTYYIAP